jgi:DNA-binding MarR family transcriptional regulator
MIQDTLNEREFELINIVGAQIANNQRDLSRHMDRSLGTINILLRRLITKGYIRTRQLNQKKVEYILTSKGFSEKTRKSIKYTLKTISSIGLIKARVKGILLNLYEEGARSFFIVGKSDLSILIEMAAKEIPLKDCSFCILQEIPLTKIEGTLLICKENVGEDDLALNNNVDLIKELAKENHYSTRLTDAALLR